jgi:hypothetical protein
MESGFNAMGKPVPENRLTAAYKTVKEICPEFDTELAMSIVGKAKECVERDEPYRLIGATSDLNEDLAKLDLTGRYRLLAVLLTEPQATTNN